HVFHHDPFSVTTARMAPDGTYELTDLRPGPVRVVAEERRPRQLSAPRLAATGAELRSGSQQTLDLEMHEPLLAKVRVMHETPNGPVPAVDVTIELSAIQNPLDVVGAYPVDAEGRAEIPLETVRSVEWVITKGSRVKTTPSGQKLTVSSSTIATPMRRMPPPPRSAALEEYVITFGADELSTSPVLISPQLAGARHFDHKDGFALFQTDSPFTFVGWATPTPGVLQFNGVPTGDYHIIYPHHGLGWISSYTIHVGAGNNGAPLDLGAVSLPALGYLKITQRDEEDARSGLTTWSDLDIKHLVAKEDGSGDAEFAMFRGRVEIPTTVPVAPGTYVLRDPSRPEKAPRWVTIKSGATVEQSWE
ncbi:MAG: hypothetical protein AAGG01_24145, partial [Planctomycetota bacterium]